MYQVDAGHSLNVYKTKRAHMLSEEIKLMLLTKFEVNKCMFLQGCLFFSVFVLQQVTKYVEMPLSNVELTVTVNSNNNKLSHYWNQIHF